MATAFVHTLCALEARPVRRLVSRLALIPIAELRATLAAFIDAVTNIVVEVRH